VTPNKPLVIEYLPVDALVPYLGNALIHSDAQVKKIAASIARFGFNNPVLIDSANVIVAGHGRLMAAKRLGLVEAPVVRLGHLSDEDRRVYRLADNRLAEDAEWDPELLAREVAAIEEEGLAQLAGFTDKEVERLLAAAVGGGGGHTNPNAAPAAPAKAVTMPGDLWQLGKHRVLCGDATSADAVSRLLAGAKPNLMVTDPPYGVEYDPNWRNEAARTSEGMGARAIGRVENDDRADWRAAWKLFPGAVAYVWHSGKHVATVAASLEVVGFKLRAQIVWVKTRPVISRGHYHWQHEPALYVAKDGADDNWRFVPEHEIAAYAVADGETADWHGDRKQSTVWNIEHVKSETGHGTQKPVECMRRPIINNSDVGDFIYEPFAGSGTTLIAAEITARSALCLELKPAYVDVIVRRWQAFTREAATLHGDGRTFDQIAGARGMSLAT
jgi:DNA modification methylase